MLNTNKNLKNLGLNIYNNKFTIVEGEELSKEEKELKEICSYNCRRNCKAKS